MRGLGYLAGRREIAEMIWEVDEDHDGHVSFAEFERSFERCIADKAGREPRKLHNVVLFALNLGEGSKKLSYDAVTRLTYINHGRVSDVKPGQERGSPALRCFPSISYFVLPVLDSIVHERTIVQQGQHLINYSSIDF